MVWVNDSVSLLDGPVSNSDSSEGPIPLVVVNEERVTEVDLGVDGVLGQNFLRGYRQEWHFPQREGDLGYLLLEPVE